MTADALSAFRAPKFTAELVADQLRDGYWLEAPDLNSDNKPDLFGYGLRLGEIYWYQNDEKWTRRLVADKIKMPVGADYADVNGNGRPDIILCYDLYGPIGTIQDANTEGGKIDWLENPGSPDKDESRWKRHYVGRATGMHRLRAGYFTQTERLEIIGLPIVAKEDVHAVLPVVMFTQPDDVQTAEEWPMTVIDDCHYRMIHGAEKKQGLIPGSDRESLLLASDEGVTWMFYDENKKEWVRKLIGTGELTQFEQTGFRGSGDLNVGRMGEDAMGYVAAVEPFHGNTVAVYTKATDGRPEDVEWNRVLLDVYGDPNENGEGPGHQIVTADFDGDGEDEFLVALRGPWPWQGVMYYKAIDLKNGVWAKWRVSDESVARIATADFNGDGRLDFATIAYSVQNYYVAKDAKLMVYRNEIDAQ
ncbi:FG-GAP repeat domain-containing protein [Streptomyces sp. AN091965]|uniref:FG-GAP repeat domain-containing protein n=1 Tax=Streptomyces sp. AN091965 TaxID=2927803 RepID=UPI001F620297|nr:VCBS repeat-containing protein [Streptomyces sp. AN091965]MCI3927770.1 VCBS repeat-containing protein [Streptomyces sp. AN091965]